MLYQRAAPTNLLPWSTGGQVTSSSCSSLARPTWLVSISARRSSADLDAATAADTFLLVPTSAAEQLRQRSRIGCRKAGQRVVWPAIGSRSDLYVLLIDRLPASPRLLSGFEREALLAAGARAAEELGAPPPFHVRPALVAEMLALYDHIRRLGRTTDDFDRLLTGELEPAADSDRGAAHARATRFLALAFRAYEERLSEFGSADGGRPGAVVGYRHHGRCVISSSHRSAV
jgi:hypothetical protein